MRLVIEFDDDGATRATLTKRPSWLGRLFGHRLHVAHVYYNEQSDHWYYEDRGFVGPDLEWRIKAERRWRTVHELPAAHVTLKP
jgi:hypothetical protein